MLQKQICSDSTLSEENLAIRSSPNNNDKNQEAI